MDKMTFSSVIDDLALFPDWESRYEYLIDLGRQLPPMADALKTDATRVHGCTSKVWLVMNWQPATESAKAPVLHLYLDSDALTVKGLLMLVYLAYQGQPASTVASFNFNQALAPTQLLANLSPNRRNGLTSVLQRIQSA